VGAGGRHAVRHRLGANQFVSLLVAYRERSGLSVATVDALVGVYASAWSPPCW